MFEIALATVLALAIPAALHAQGVLTLTPGRNVATSAGTGTVGYTGDGGPAASATLADPSAVAYDANGNIFLADAANDVVREISKSGTITTIAGSGIEGFSGDGGAATSALLDKPTGVAVDASGNVYIADSHNNRIRKVSAGTITTIAGNGTSGFTGDGAAATAAELSLPSAVAVDSAGNVYIADTNNDRIRKLTGTTISTIAGDGEELFAGDGSAATSAALDSPTGVAVDKTGNVYIADRHNQRVREVAVGGTISTLAGSGAASFSGSFSGDGASSASAALARPSGVSVDSSGNVYIADTDNQRIRQVAGGAIATVAGTGAQGFGGDGGPATGAILNTPRAVAVDAGGDFTVADTFNQRLRSGLLPTLTFTNDGVGVLSAPQSITLSNTGSASLAVSSVAFMGAFTTAPGGTCTATPITLAAGASCTQDVAFLPTATGAASGSVAFSGTGVVSQSLLLAGTGVQTATSTILTSTTGAPLFGTPITFIATIKLPGLGTPTGTVSFLDGGTLIGTPQPVTGGAASITTLALPAGTQNITAVYSGDANFTGSSSLALPETVENFDFSVGGAGSSLTVVPGQAVTFDFTLQPLDGPFTYPITFSATGLPPGATATFKPQSITLGSSPASFTMTIQTVQQTAAVHPVRLFGGGTLTFALLLLPFSRRMRKRARKIRKLRPVLLGILLLTGLGAAGTLSGCGSGNRSGFFGQPQQTYTIQVIGTVAGPNGTTLQQSTTVQLTVE